VIAPYRRYAADEKAAILATIAQVQAWCPEKELDAILGDLGLPPATYHRWCERAEHQKLADRIVVPHRNAVPPTPVEVACVRAFAEHHFALGYKRLAYSLMLENQAFLYPWMVHAILSEAHLLGRRQPAPELLDRKSVV
jgi:hypothetical protein